MKSGYNSHKFMNMLGGINSATADTAVSNEQFVDAMNVSFVNVGHYGRVDKRKGKVKYVSTQPNGSNTIQGIYDFIRREDDKKRLITVSGGNVYWNKGGTWAEITTGLDTNEKFAFTEYINSCLWTNKKDGVYQWDGITDPELITGAPKFKDIVTFKNHIFGYGVEAYPYTLYWSELGDVTSYPAVNIVNFDENITGLGVLPNVLVVFTENTFWYMTGSDSDDFGRHELNPNVGCIAPHSIEVIDRDVFFLAKDGVYKANMAGTYDKVSGNIEDKIREINPIYYEECHATHDKQKHQYLLSVPVAPGTTNTRVFIYDYLFESWTVEDHSSAVLTLSERIDGQFSVLGGGYDGYVYEHYQSGNDDGTAIDAWMETKWIDFGDPSTIHEIKWLKVYYNAVGEHILTTKVYTNWQKNDEQEFTLYMNGGVNQLGVSWYLNTDSLYADGISVGLIPIYIRGNSIKLRFANAEDNKKFQLYGYELLERPIGVGIDG